MVKGRSGEAPPRVMNIIWARSAGWCQFRGCQVNLIGDLASGGRHVKQGYHAHIIGSSAKGPRGDEVLSADLAKSSDNVMLLCDMHHRLIDGAPADWPVDVLRDMKREHEEWVADVLALRLSSRSEILQFSATIGSNETAIPVDMCSRAMIAIDRTPANFRPIEIKVRGSGLADSDPDYWKLEVNRLRSRFAELVKGRFEEGKFEHLSVFAFGPMPLLMELGRLISDISEVTVFQRHREPEPTWTWAEDQLAIGLSLLPGQPGPKRVALKVAVSARIDDDRITRVVGTDASIWEITCREPHNDVMRSQDDLSRFRALLRQAYEGIRQVHGEGAEVSVFPACPVSCAVEMGRVWQPKVHLPFDVYDHTANAGFVLRHRINV